MAEDQAEGDGLLAAGAFIAELRHWREVAGVSQKALARLTGYTPSYVSKVERGALVPSRQFADSADRALKAGQAIIRAWKRLRADTVAAAGPGRVHESVPDDPQSDPSAALVVEHEDARLSFDGVVFTPRIRRLLRNVGDEPVTRYLIRIAVDRYPGDPERSNRLYRADPLTWEELSLTAWCRDEPMNWKVKHDRDAFKELWLLFENGDGRFPLYPGETAWIDYTHTVTAGKWGPWWQRAIRLPTRRLSLRLDFPADLDPAVWGMRTSMTAEASPFRTPIIRETLNDAAGERAVFTWSTEDPPLHARFRVEWKFKAATVQEEAVEPSAAQKMTAAGVVQEGDPILTEAARRFGLPAEAEDARRVIAQLAAVMERVAQEHVFAKGIGLAAPQIGIGRAAALARTPDGDTITLLNPRIVSESADTDERYEGCLSFFDVRGSVPRPLRIEVEHQDTDGTVKITVFDHGIARLVAHEIDHLNGILYKTRMRPDLSVIPVSEYKGTGRSWAYKQP